MDSRRFDRNADQLSQVYHHLSLVPQYVGHDVFMMRHDALKLIEQLLKINDKLGEMAGKGLI